VIDYEVWAVGSDSVRIGHFATLDMKYKPLRGEIVWEKTVR
jgi:hypothetical protein